MQVGQRVTISPEWEGDDTVYTVEEWNDGRGYVKPIGWPHGKIAPLELVTEEMIVKQRYEAEVEHQRIAWESEYLDQRDREEIKL